MHWYWRWLGFGLWLGVAGAVQAEDAASRIAAAKTLVEAQSEALFGQPDPERDRALQSLYRELRADQLHALDLDALDEASLQALIEIVGHTNLFCSVEEAADLALQAAQVLQSRQQLKDLSATRVLNQLFCTDQYAKLQEFAALIGRQLPALPEGMAERNDQFGVLRFTAGETPRYTREPLQNGVLVIADPHCRPSRALLQASSADPEIGAVLAQAMWLTPRPNLALYQALIDAAERPDGVRYRAASRMAAWPNVPDWATPQVLFFHDGALLARVSGWPKEGRKPELMQAVGAYCTALEGTNAPSWCANRPAGGG